MGHHTQIAAPCCRCQERLGTADPLALADVVAVVTDTLAGNRIQIGSTLQAKGLTGADQILGQRITVVPAKGNRDRSALGPAVLQSAEYRLHLRPAPARAALLLPALVILRLTTGPDHAVDCRGASQPLAANPGFGRTAVPGTLLGNAVLPGMLGAAHQPGNALGHPDHETVVAPTCFQQQDSHRRISRQPTGQYAAGRACAYNNIIIGCCHGYISCPIQ